MKNCSNGSQNEGKLCSLAPKVETFFLFTKHKLKKMGPYQMPSPIKIIISRNMISVSSHTASMNAVIARVGMQKRMLVNK